MTIIRNLLLSAYLTVTPAQAGQNSDDGHMNEIVQELAEAALQCGEPKDIYIPFFGLFYESKSYHLQLGKIKFWLYDDNRNEKIDRDDKFIISHEKRAVSCNFSALEDCIKSFFRYELRKELSNLRIRDHCPLPTS